MLLSNFYTQISNTYLIILYKIKKKRRRNCLLIYLPRRIKMQTGLRKNKAYICCFTFSFFNFKSVARKQSTKTVVKKHSSEVLKQNIFY